ncbi:MAG: hypothetical protein JNL21_24270 [Myxococcales bacterium]|nr:hypothetical protein [Myxococcales bacterium]
MRPTIGKPSRIHAYGVLLFGSIAAGVVGLAFDQLTVSLSPEYFVLGKGLREDGLRLQVAWLGFRSALPAGALVAGLGLLRSRGQREFSWRSWLLRFAAGLPVTLATLPLAMMLTDPFAVRASSAGAMSDAACSRYLAVWGMHIGAYVGTALGICFAFWSARPSSRPFSWRARRLP